jgi:hypothetical protein
MLLQAKEALEGIEALRNVVEGKYLDLRALNKSK